MPDLKKLILAGHGSFLKLALTNTDKSPIISHYKYVKTEREREREREVY